MKRGKKIGILCGLLCGISLAAFGVSRYEQQKEQIKNSEEIILKVVQEEVKTLSWKCGTGSFAFHRDENGAWLYDADEDFPVDEGKIGELLEQFQEFGVSFVIEEVEDWEQYGLQDPLCTICMETEGGACEILLGGYSTMDSQRYVSIGDGNAYLVKQDPLESFELEISDMIRHDGIPDLKNVVQLQFTGQASGRIFYEEDSASAYYAGDVYFMEQGDGSRPLDTDRVNSYLSTVRNLNLKDYVDYDVSEEDLAGYGLDAPVLSLSIDYTVAGEETGEERKERFILHIGLDPAQQGETGTDGMEISGEGADGEDAPGEGTSAEAVSAGDASDEDVTAYARIGDSRIIYQISSEQYRKLMDMSYDSLRHQEIFWADFSDVYQMDILLEGETYTITSEAEEGERTCFYRGEETDITGIKNAVKGLRAKVFTEEEPDQKEEIGLTLYLENENAPEVRIQLFRYDGKDCIAVVDGKPAALVERAYVVDLIEAVNGIVLN